ncbi:MAG: sigma 54-interacting transcriptional regulator [Candidatus Binatia bacterium]|nr:sigma 54-interacting transcriptional regulator [Candidatus Binatia bacterium]
MSEASARLFLTTPEGDTRIVPLGDLTRIGRAANSDLVIEDSSVSRRHALIQLQDDGGHILTDLGSANGTTVNDELISLPVVLRDGDSVGIAGYQIVFSGERPGDADGQSGDTLFNTEDSTVNEERGHRRHHRVQIVGGGPGMLEVLGQVRQAASSSIPVLITGETGTGKELVARSIHQGGSRASQVFVPINCSALPEALLESELFGHRRGAFTGAQQDRAGLFEAAKGGTVFLDEVGELPIQMQPKLLRFLQDGEVRRVGDVEPRHVDVRVISATNRDLKSEIEREAFREDLYFRLSTFTIELPPLRARPEDIALLAERLLRTQAELQKKRVRGIEPAALEALGRYDWPGNVRELENELARAVAILHEGDRITLSTLSPRVSGPQPDAASTGDATPPPATDHPTELRGAMTDFERTHIAEVLEQNGGNVSKAAQALGLSRGGLHKKLKELGLR